MIPIDDATYNINQSHQQNVSGYHIFNNSICGKQPAKFTTSITGQSAQTTPQQSALCDHFCDANPSFSYSLHACNLLVSNIFAA